MASHTARARAAPALARPRRGGTRPRLLLPRFCLTKPSSCVARTRPCCSDFGPVQPLVRAPEVSSQPRRAFSCCTSVVAFSHFSRALPHLPWRSASSGPWRRRWRSSRYTARQPLFSGGHAARAVSMTEAGLSSARARWLPYRAAARRSAQPAIGNADAAERLHIEEANDARSKLVWELRKHRRAHGRCAFARTRRGRRTRCHV